MFTLVRGSTLDVRRQILTSKVYLRTVRGELDTVFNKNVPYFEQRDQRALTMLPVTIFFSQINRS